MQKPQEARPRAKSPFTAAFLSLIFPGLGHLYAGALMRALGFAALPILLIALGAGTFLRMDRLELVGLVFNPFLLNSVFVANILFLLYRLVAIIDAYRVTEWMNAVRAGGDGRLGRARLSRAPLSIAGLLAVLLVMAGSHVVVARYDMIAIDALTSGCIFVGDDVQECAEEDPDASASPDASSSAAAGASDEPIATPTPEPTVDGTPLPEVSIAPWDGKERLNILLIGSDKQGGGHRTDTLITVSIDPVTKKVAMFSLPRDTKNVPLPPGPARSFWGRTFGQKINSFYIQNRDKAKLWPGSKSTRGYNALKATLGELYDLDIKYFVEVDFDGFKSVVDAIGGVTVNVQLPVVDDAYPAGVDRSIRLYIPSGLQHMNGTQALRYARSRNTSSDFDRAARQQRLLLSMREQADPQTLVPRLPELVKALKKSVKNAFKLDPELEARREALSGEGATVWVLNGTSDRNRGFRLAGYLENQGLAASAPRGKPDGAVPADTEIVVYNGAEAKMPATVAYLESRFKTKVTTVDDPAVRADVVITIGRSTPDLRPPPSS